MIKEKPKVAILMATYNGEKYIDQQIGSIIEQDYQEWDLFISDDGSKDKTVDIIRSFGEHDPRIKKILFNMDHGAFSNFYCLLRYAQKNLADKYDVFCLCDQDDIWEKDKIRVEVNAIANNHDENVLVYSDLAIMNADNSLTGKKMSDYFDIELKNCYDIFFNSVFVWGNTIAISNALMKRINFDYDISKQYSHDQFLAVNAVIYGKVVYINKPIVRYRRYTGNVSGFAPKKSVTGVINKVLLSCGKTIEKHGSYYVNILKVLDNCDKEAGALDDIRKAYLCGGVQALKVIKKYGITPGPTRESALYNRLILMTGLHKRTRAFKNYMK